MAPSKMKAIKMVDQGKAEIQEVPLPRLRDDYVLVKVKDVALNPADWDTVDAIAEPGTTIGFDFAGTVEEIGPKVTKEWQKGDRIAGVVHGGNNIEPEDGGFAEYLVAKGDLGMKIPDDMSDEEASTLGVGVSTVGQALYQRLGLPLPGSGKAGIPLLIYGGSTATGSLAIQYAILSGCEVITTCSPRNFPFVKSLGAAEVFDYNDPECAQNIRAYTQDKLTKALDCISEASSAEICSQAISSGGGEVSYLQNAAKHARKDVKTLFTFGLTVIGERFRYRQGVEVPASQEDFEFAKMFWELSTKLIASKQISVHPPKVGKDGLKGAFEGMQMMKEGKVSGTKLVYRVAETP